MQNPQNKFVIPHKRFAPVNSVDFLKQKEWEIINRFFFKNFYKNSNVKFHLCNLDQREKMVADFINKNKTTNKDIHHKFDKAWKKLVKFNIRQSFSPYSAYGYPDKRTLPFSADPSWPEYHLEPGSLL